jgi:hypothetical protein
MSSQTLMNYLAGGAVEHDTPPLLLGELGLLRGVVRADLALVGSAMLHGVEVKTARDSLRRLPQQVAGYSRVFHRVTLAAEARHIARAAALVPPWWGVVTLCPLSEEGEAAAHSSVPNSDPVLPAHANALVEVVRPGGENPALEPRALCELLWRAEALCLLDARGSARGVQSKPRAAVWDRLATVLTLPELSAAVCAALRARRAGTP